MTKNRDASARFLQIKQSAQTGIAIQRHCVRKMSARGDRVHFARRKTRSKIRRSKTRTPSLAARLYRRSIVKLSHRHWAIPPFPAPPRRAYRSADSRKTRNRRAWRGIVPRFGVSFRLALRHRSKYPFAFVAVPAPRRKRRVPFVKFPVYAAAPGNIRVLRRARRRGNAETAAWD